MAFVQLAGHPTSEPAVPDLETPDEIENMDNRWLPHLTASYFDEKASWLREERGLHDSSLRFFNLAGKLVLLARDDYELASVAFSQAILGLERALRIYFSAHPHTPLESVSFSSLLGKAVEEKFVTDDAFSANVIFSEAKRFSKVSLEYLAGRKTPLAKSVRAAATHCHALAILLPNLRNSYMHGEYLLSPAYLHLTFQLREIVDALFDTNGDLT